MKFKVETRGKPGKESEVESKWSKITDTLRQISSVGWVVAQLRPPYNLPQVVGAAVSIGTTIPQIYSRWCSNRSFNAAGIFEYDDSPWSFVPPKISHALLADEEVLEKMVPGSETIQGGKIQRAAFTAVLYGVEFGWTGDVGSEEVPGFVWTKDMLAFRIAVSNKLWKKVGDSKIGYLTAETLDQAEGVSIVPLEEHYSLLARCRTFLQRKRSRAVLLDGPPGTGKSSAALWVAQQMGLSALLIDMNVLTNNGAAERMQLVRLMLPDVLIFNDLDRLSASQQKVLLDMLELTRQWCKLVFVTSNNMNRLIRAARRPGRIDDVFTIGGLKHTEIAKIFPDRPDLHILMDGWPVAYVIEFYERFAALGEEAIEEIAGLQARIIEDAEGDVDWDGPMQYAKALVAQQAPTEPRGAELSVKRQKWQNTLNELSALEQALTAVSE